MAKTSSVQRNLKRIRKVNSTREKRKQLKMLIKKGSVDEQEEAMLKIQKLKRDESPTRIRNRCRQCGRPCGTLRKFGLCRIHLREAAMMGNVPGLKKASW